MVEIDTTALPEGETGQKKEIIPLTEMQQIDGGNFILIPLPKGTVLETRQSQLRRENLPMDFPASEARRVNEGEKKIWRA